MEDDKLTGPCTGNVGIANFVNALWQLSGGALGCIFHPRADAHIPLSFPFFSVTGRTFSDQVGNYSLVSKNELHTL